MGVVTLLLMLVNKVVLDIFTGAEYSGAWVYSPVLMVAFFMGALGTFWGSFYIASKNTKTYLASAAAGAGVNLILNFVLIHSFGAIGAAVATAASYLCVFLVRGICICKKIQVKVINFQVVTSGACLSMGLLAAYLHNGWAWGVGLANLAVYLLLNRKLLIGAKDLALTLLRRNR